MYTNFLLMREGDKFLTYNLRSWIYKATTSSNQFPQKIFLPWKLQSYRLIIWCPKWDEGSEIKYPIFSSVSYFSPNFLSQLSHHIDLECTGQRPWSSSPPGPSRPCGHNVPSETARPPETPRPPETTGPSGPLGTPGALRIPGTPGPPSQALP